MLDIDKKGKQHLSMRMFIVDTTGRAKRKMTYGKDKKETEEL